jgi:hypothetical protein
MIETIAMPYGRSVRYIGVARRKGGSPRTHAWCQR